MNGLRVGLHYGLDLRNLGPNHPLTNPIFILKTGPKFKIKLPKLGVLIFVGGNRQDFTGKWWHISTTSFLRTMEVDPAVKTLGPNVSLKQ